MEVAGLALGIVGAVGVIGYVHFLVRVQNRERDFLCLRNSAGAFLSLFLTMKKQLLDGCLKGYHIFTTASNLGRDSERLVCKIRIEEMRLVIWGREWGVSEGQFEKTFAPGTAQEGLRGLAEMILTQLYQTVMDLNKLQDKYGLREEAPGSVDKEAYKHNANPKTLLARSADKPSAPSGVRLRAKWVITDKDKFTVFLEDLQFYNDKLEKLFPPGRNLQRAWTNELLENAQQDLSKLDLLEAASKPLYPGLSSMAQLKQLRINLDAKEPNKKILSSSTLKIRRDQLVIDANETNGALRSRAVYQQPSSKMHNEIYHEDVDVFVEWTSFEATADIEERCQIYNKVDSLARMLHASSNRHPDLHTLDCLGYVDDTSNGRYGMVYLIPLESENNSTLQNLSTLIISTPAPDLDVRFRLAHTIAVALWSCHSLDWLHKTLCPRNILFFDGHNISEASGSSLSQPYLAGFDSSRPDHLEEMSIAPKNLMGEELYRHPSSLGTQREKYRKAFDVYSLGLLLLEIGMWKGLQEYLKGRTSKYSPAAFRDKLIQGLVPALGSKAGSRYRTIVHRCLSYEDTDQAPKKGLSAHQMMESVVQGLESLNV